MIYIIIPVFNRLKYTINCLKSIANQSYKDFKIIVVDDGSSDGTYEYIISNFKHVTVIKGNGELWWTGATNLGIQKALETSSTDDFILTLNNDLIVDSDYLENLLLTYRNCDEKTLIGSLCVDIDYPDKVVFAGINWNEFTAKYKPVINLNKTFKEISKFYPTLDSDLLTGRGTLIPIHVFQEVGFFDFNNFPQYAADEDFSLRCRKKGYKCKVSSHAVVRSHTKATGASSLHLNLSINDFLKSLVSIKSPNNLSKKWIWSKKHSKIPPLYFIFSLTRLSFSFLKSCYKSNKI